MKDFLLLFIISTAGDYGVLTVLLIAILSLPIIFLLVGTPIYSN